MTTLESRFQRLPALEKYFVRISPLPTLLVAWLFSCNSLRRLGPIILFDDPTALASFFDQLQRRLKKVDIQPQGLIQLSQNPTSDHPLEAIVADEMPHNCPVFLLNETLIVLFVGSGPSKVDSLFPTVRI
jgi:hypothetical protein